MLCLWIFLALVCFEVFKVVSKAIFFSLCFIVLYGYIGMYGLIGLGIFVSYYKYQNEQAQLESQGSDQWFVVNKGHRNQKVYFMNKQGNVYRM